MCMPPTRMMNDIPILFSIRFVFAISVEFICLRYLVEQAWFLDQFGVLHDGKQPYPGAVMTCMFSSVSFDILVSLFISFIVFLSNFGI